MSIEQLTALAIVQGLTEFLPISSSGHLNLLHILTDWTDQGIVIDIAVHVGSLLAVLVYFHHDIRRLAGGFATLLTGKKTPDSELARHLILASLPIFILGVFAQQMGYVNLLRTAAVIAWANMAFAIVLYFADKKGGNEKSVASMTRTQAVLIGCAQMFAIIPGASRAGVTISMARYLGFERREAARFSMLLAIPAILGAAAAAQYDLYNSGNFTLQADALIAAALAFLAAWAAIAIFMRLLSRITLLPFVIYRVILGAVLLGWIYGAG